jgi:hypothetical protein
MAADGAMDRRGRPASEPTGRQPTAAQGRWLARGLAEPGGKLPLFDERGRKVSRRTVEACLRSGWAERWFDNPLKPDWLVCRLTPSGRAAVRALDDADPRQ